MNLLEPRTRTPRPFAPTTGASNQDDWFALNDWVGIDRPSQRDDVVKVEALLANAGDYSLKRNQGQTGYWGTPQDVALRSYQARNNLAVDGRLRPGGPTIEKLRSQLAGTMAGFKAPTAAEIDTHHRRLSAGDAGLVAWGPQPMNLAPRNDLPEIGADVHASNGRWIAAMDRGNGFSSYPDLFARSITEHGDSAVAEVRDLVGQYEALHPGNGAKLTGEIVAALPDDATRRSFLGTDAPTPRALGSVLKAQAIPLPPIGGMRGRMPVPGTMPPLSNLPIPQSNLPGVLGVLGAATVVPKMILDAAERRKADPQAGPANPPPSTPQNPIPPLPGMTPTDPSPTVLPGRIPPEERATILQNIPELPQEERDAVVDDLFGPIIVEITYGDDKQDNRGTDATVEGTNVVAEEIMAAVKKSRFPDAFVHKGGASVNGERNTYQKETMVNAESGRRRYPDLTFGDENDADPGNAGHVNTVTVRKDGSPTGREQAALDDLRKTIKDGIVEQQPKLTPGENMEAYRLRVREFASGFADRLIDKILQRRERANQGETKP